MKILNPGARDVAWWWVGRKALCPTCGWEAEFEKGDQDRICHSFTQFEMSIACPNCQDQFKALRDQAPIRPIS